MQDMACAGVLPDWGVGISGFTPDRCPSGGSMSAMRAVMTCQEAR